MLGAVSLFGLVGYSLIYAAVANGGSLARNPWLALTHDAYAVGTNGAPSTQTTSTFDSIIGWSLKISSWVTNPFGGLLGGGLP